ncbi:hypothetical protein EIP86_001807 [Pleurotus ostreatoroseus]|nr:hypothetical protein EIP86_001807 [Pleurotus ostreatoroseus]
MRVLAAAALVLTAALPALVAADDESLRLLHRLYHPSLPAQPFTDRGRLVLSRAGSASVTTASLVPADTVEADLSTFAAAAQSVEYDPDLALYQLALERPGDTHHTQWHVSAVKACHALSSTSSTLTLHLTASGASFALDAFVAPVPHNGACPKPSKARRPVTADASERDASGAHQFRGLTNSTVLVRAPAVPPL